MSSNLGLPTQGSDVTVVITKVHLHPLCVLVEFWGKFCQERTADYERLAKDIQSPGNALQELEGNPGEQCLVEIDGTWYRTRIVSRNGSKYIVFLIDKGVTYSATTSKLAWGKKTHFHLPPEVEYCVLANVLPLSPENRWSPVALDFLKSLTGKSVKAHVQNVLVQHRTFLMHIPCISKQMYEMGIAKMLSADMFQDFVLMSLQSHTGAEVGSGNRQISMGPGERLHKQELFMYPELPAGTVETVIITDVMNPQRIFCQLKVFSQELKKLSDQLTQCCEGRMTNCIVGPEMVGYPCAARGNDGRWYRSILQQVFPTNKGVEVLNVDYGTKQFVQVDNVRPLAVEFFRMPVVTYICSLHGIIDKGVGWTTSQIDHLKTLLLYKTVIAKFEYQSISEGVYYVTLYGHENTNINNLFGSKESCLLACEKTLGDYTIRSTASSHKHPAPQEGNQRKMPSPGQSSEEKKEKGIGVKLPAEDLSLNSSHVAVVQHISDPSEFWIQTQNYANELDELLDNIYCLYKDSVNGNVVRNPTVGLYCAAKAEDGDFYRATVAEVGLTQIKVFFVDYGNTEMVDRNNIRTLPDELKKLPCLALKCTLADIRPKDGKWTQSACEFFIRAVTDKTLNVHVTAKYDDCYVVQLADPEAQGERNLATLMCSSGFGERTETQRQPKAKMTTQLATPLPTQLANARHSGVYWNNGMSFQTLYEVDHASNKERRIPSFKEHMFPIGSVLDVNVSYIESPNDFWCQLVQNAGQLKLLMHDIQAHYTGSEFQPFLDKACVALHPDNGMWYRALVIHKHETPHVDVLFVDYGQMETVSLYDLRRICPEFLTLHGQAFRCSLLNPVDPTSATNEWNDEAKASFHSFVETAASNFVILKCTIYAVMYSEQKIVFNIVDLETPFESASTTMINLVKCAPPKKAAGPSFRLDTYFYSTHNIKTGTEEEVTVTCVKNVCQFYCQLERNVNVMKDLTIKVSNLCHQLENIKLPTVFGTLCFAKYTDGEWYRGQIKAVKPAILVHFVDYGDTIEVEKSDLLPIPKEAGDIMSVPVQAVVCSLSDVPAEVPSEMNSWFEKSVTECKFKALIVAREPDGKLLVELYHGKNQINSKIKKMFQIEMHTEEHVVRMHEKVLEATANHVEKTPKAIPKQDVERRGQNQIKKNFSALKPTRQMSNATMNPQSAQKPLHHACENGQKVKAAPLQLYTPPHQRQPCEKRPSNAGNSSELANAYSEPKKESLPPKSKPFSKSEPPGTEAEKESNVEKVPKLEDLPSKSITSGMEADVYVSHCNSPLSFYVQLVKEEDEIFSLVEKLNDSQSNPQTNDLKDVHPGDLVQAEFADDSSLYRAVVKEIHNNTMALVEFVDFGNSAMTPISKIGRLQTSFLQLPMYSTHCMLSDAAVLGKDKVLDPEVITAFKDDIRSNGGKVFRCQFIKQSGSMWEVSLEDRDMKVTCTVPTQYSTDGSEIASEKIPAQSNVTRQEPENSQKLQLSSCSLCYHQQEFIEGQKLEVYITATDDTQSFWCQPVDSEELDKIQSSVSEVGDAADHKHIDPGALSLGSPCVALFSDDHLWYRAEVIDKDGDELSVLFVDYGNKSQVNVKDVREMPTDLMKTPPQAFLCELDGFDASHGSWDRGAADELSELTTDKVSELTVTRVRKEEEKIKYLVQMECEGQVINEALKTWWKSSMTENESGAVTPTTAKETPLQCDSTVNKTDSPDDQQECRLNQELDAAVACIHPQRDDGKEQRTGELSDPQTPDQVPELACTSKHSQSPGDYLRSEFFVKSPEEESDQILAKSRMTNPAQILKATESLSENVSNDEMNLVPTRVVSQTKPKDILPCDVGIEETLLPPLDNKGGQEILNLSCDKSVLETDKGNEEEGASVMDTNRPDDLHSPLNENPTEAIDESEIDLESLPVELNAYNMESSFDVIFSDPTEHRNDNKVTIARDNPLTNSTTTVKMVPREAAFSMEKMDQFEKSEEVQQIQTELVLPSCLLPAFDEEQESEAVDVLPKEEMPCITRHVENDLMAEEKTSAHHEDIFSALLVVADTAASETHTCTSPSENMGDRVEELTFSVEGACLTDVFTVPKEPHDDGKVPSAGDYSLSSRTAEEMIQTELVLPSCLLPAFDEEQESEAVDVLPKEEMPCITRHVENDLMAEEKTSAHHEDIFSALLVVADTAASEPHTCTSPSKNMGDRVEELTCSVEGACLTDVCTVPKEPSDDGKVPSAGDYSLSSRTAEEMIQTELVLPSCLLPAFDEEQESEAVDVLPKEEMPCITRHVENDLMAEEKTSAHHEDIFSALLVVADTAASEPHTCTSPSENMGDRVEELTCSVEGACLTDVFTDPKEPHDDGKVPSAGDYSLSSRTAEEMGTLVEEVTCLVGKICLKDVCRGPAQEAETEEQLVHMPLKQEQGFCDGVLGEEVSSADESFEAQLIRITHLSLIINDGSTDILPIERQPEE